MKSNIDALLIEDSCSDAQLVKTIINSSDSEKPKLHHVKRFREALEILETNTFDVVLLDLNLPDGRGLKLIKQLKQLVPKTPIVVFTGLQDQAMADAALQEGAQDYVVKSDTFSPVRLSQLGHTNIGNLLVQRLQYAIKRTELAQKSEIKQERYALIAQGANDGIWDWDLSNNRIYYSPQWQSRLGLYSHDCSNSPDEWLLRIHPEDQTHFKQKLQDYLAGEYQQFHCEYRIQHANGDYLWVLTRGTALWDEAGIPYRIVGSQTDMTAVKRVHRGQQKQGFAQTTLQTIAIGIISNLASLYLESDRYSEAAPLLEGTLTMRKWLLGDTHFDVAINLYQLAILYDDQGRYKKAEALYREALQLFEENLGSKHTYTNVIRIKVLLISRMNQVIGI
ncbi:MAG: PAS domain-containing protein [Cyanobacteria bacterium P01_H01_bin.21]